MKKNAFKAPLCIYIPPAPTPFAMPATYGIVLPPAPLSISLPRTKTFPKNSRHAALGLLNPLFSPAKMSALKSPSI